MQSLILRQLTIEKKTKTLFFFFVVSIVMYHVAHKKRMKARLAEIHCLTVPRGVGAWDGTIVAAFLYFFFPTLFFFSSSRGGKKEKTNFIKDLFDEVIKFEVGQNVLFMIDKEIKKNIKEIYNSLYCSNSVSLVSDSVREYMAATFFFCFFFVFWKRIG